MNFLPTWMPNLHPLIVHFPVGILLLALLLQGVALFLKESYWRTVNGIILGIGILSLVVTWFSGRIAVDSVQIPFLANEAVIEHSDLALWTLLFFLAYGILYLLYWYRQTWQGKKGDGLLLVTGLLGAGLLAATADHGGRLVYQYGLAVAGIESSESVVQEETEHYFNLSQEGNWTWTPGENESDDWVDQVQWQVGSPDDISLAVESKPELGTHLAFYPKEKPVLFVMGDTLAAVQIDVTVDLSGFDGNFQILHHFNNMKNYDFLSLTPQVAEMGRMEDGTPNIETSGEYVLAGPAKLSVIGMKRHFRFHVNDKLVLHSHAGDLPPGPVGIYMNGTGVIRIKSITVQTMDKEGHDD
ncbi:MAG: DUF2231 domain-containing protein [Fidelibacterota bacterium]